VVLLVVRQGARFGEDLMRRRGKQHGECENRNESTPRLHGALTMSIRVRRFRPEIIASSTINHQPST